MALSLGIIPIIQKKNSQPAVILTLTFSPERDKQNYFFFLRKNDIEGRQHNYPHNIGKK